MPTRPREWPNNAKWSRDEAAMLAFRGQKKCRQLLDNWNDVSEVSKVTLVAQVLDILHQVDELMTQVGAQRKGV